MSSRFPFTRLIHSPAKPELVLAHGEDFLVLNTSNGQMIKKLSGESTKETIADNYRSMSFSKDGSLFIASGENKSVCVWNTSDWSLKTSRPAHKRVNAIQFNSNASLGIAADKFGDVYCHNFSVSEEEKLNPILGHVSMVTDMVLTSDDKYVITADRDEHIRVSRFPNGYNIESFCLGHTDVITHISLLPWNESLLVSAGGDGTVRVWDYLNGKQIQSLDIKEQIEQYKPVASDANSEDAIVDTLAICEKEKLLVVGFGKSPALIVLEWTEDEFVYKETVVTSLPILDVTFDLQNQLWVSSDASKEDGANLISVFRLDNGKFSLLDSSDSLVSQINQTETLRVNIMPEIYSVFGLRKFLDLAEGEGDDSRKSKKKKTE
ncbi:WD40-repeat-containing domain protein [Sporodiniella umbellata]|nr:WD40-repeat-containing domain protein [Sporodiniella umbellata]